MASSHGMAAIYLLPYEKGSSSGESYTFKEIIKSIGLGESGPVRQRRLAEAVHLDGSALPIISDFASLGGGQPTNAYTTSVMIPGR